MTPAVHLNFDDAWPAGTLGLPSKDLRHWGPRLRYCAPAREVEAFWREIEPAMAPFVLYGSGDFHYVAGVILRRVREPVTLISFDNHPDWDIRPPRWACGGWINRALELPTVEAASVWGCGNFELAFPSRLFANRKAMRDGRLTINAWAERQTVKTAKRFGCMTRENWRERFEEFAKSLAGKRAYVTVDLDALRVEEAATNWENGLFSADDIAWALRTLRAHAPIVAGDVCGAYSSPIYARWRQRFAGNWDHPKLLTRDAAEARHVNERTLGTIWKALIGE